jgi:hypothetical protein
MMQAPEEMAVMAAKIDENRFILSSAKIFAQRLLCQYLPWEKVLKCAVELLSNRLDSGGVLLKI